jgi:hypothetical protein
MRVVDADFLTSSISISRQLTARARFQRMWTRFSVQLFVSRANRAGPCARQLGP